MRQLRWIFGLTGLATVAILVLQAYIWDEGIKRGREHFEMSLSRAVEEAVEEYIRPLESHVMLSSVVHGDSFAFKSPGVIAIQIGTRDTLRLSHQVPQLSGDSVDVNAAFFDMSFVHNRVKMVEDTSLNGVWSRADSLLERVLVRERMRCDSCNAGFTQVSRENFRPLLEKELALLDIESDFEWGVQHLGNWVLVDGEQNRLESSKWHFPFFAFPMPAIEHATEASAAAAAVTSSENVFRDFSPPVISLYFPGEYLHVLRSIGPTLLASSLLGFMVLGCIGYALYVILRQKQLSEIKTDFINNMTHEFKTPISTIALACEALQDGDVEIPKASRAQYLNMIATENERLGHQVEKVLQMALLDKEDLGLKMEPVNVHLLLKEIVEAFSLRVSQREGKISTSLGARKDVVEGDMMHLRQMLANLLDNANKYSPDRPEISIETTNKDAGIEIAVHDKGLGISRDALRKIFDRFYRVPTGNLHDVKGFGLGLSYVHTMALAHGGHVRATSKPGVGSSFYLYLPYQNG